MPGATSRHEPEFSGQLTKPRSTALSVLTAADRTMTKQPDSNRALTPDLLIVCAQMIAGPLFEIFLARARRGNGAV
jgi:hypothetical protein